MAAKKLKTSDKAALLTKLTTALKKKYGSKVPKSDRAVLESYLYAACLEDTIDEAADVAYAKLLDSFHDLNEIRVSTVREIERPIDSLPEPEFRAMRIREALHHVFEKHFAFDLDSLKKKNLDGASNDLDAITAVTPFIKLFTLQNGLGAHVLPLDKNQFNVLVWLGIVNGKTQLEAASDELKGAVRKSDGPLFAFLLRQVANEPNLIEEISLTDDEEDEVNPSERLKLLGDVLDGKHQRKKKKTPAKKAPAKKKPAAKKKTTTKKKTSKKTAPKKSTSKKSTSKKSAPAKKKTATKTAKKTSPKKAAKKKKATKR